MKLLSSLALLVSAVAANPIARASNATDTFHLKTAGASETKHNDLYVYGYHTGAGFNDAVLTSDADTANTVFLNNTHAQFALDTPFPWGLNMRPQNNYAGEYRFPPGTGSGQAETDVYISICSVGTGPDQHRIRQRGILNQRRRIAVVKSDLRRLAGYVFSLRAAFRLQCLLNGDVESIPGELATNRALPR